jgi:hypothetical protein
MKRNMQARAVAREEGRKTYETCLPCKKGHISPRATLTGTCVECTRQASLAWLDRHPGKGASYTAAYRERNRGEVLQKGRVAMAIKRLKNPEHFKDLKRKSYRTKAQEQGRVVRDKGRLAEAEVLARMAFLPTGIEYVSGYTTIFTKAVFRCVKHGMKVSATPHNVMRGANPCHRCNHMKSSGEEEVARFLSIFVPVLQRTRKLLRPRELDIHIPATALAVEYCGEFYHSHGSSEAERERRHKHFEKYQDCVEKGVRLITLYESEWKLRNHAIKRLLRNAIGAMKGRLVARQCELVRVASEDARLFFERYHIQGGGGHGDHYGLVWKDKLVACMRFTFGANDRGPNGARSWTLTRYATRIPVVGGASRLFTAFLREQNPAEVKSFSDNRFFDGAMYLQLGFRLDKELAPDYIVWSPKIGLRPKSDYQRKALPERLLDHGMGDVFDPKTDPRTEAEITYLMGARRLYDCGKKRWIWSLDSTASAC